MPVLDPPPTPIHRVDAVRWRLIAIVLAIVGSGCANASHGEATTSRLSTPVVAPQVEPGVHC